MAKTFHTAASHPHPPPAPPPHPTTQLDPILQETGDVEDVQLLAQAIVTLVQTSAYDDMTWMETDAAFRLASSVLKRIWAQHGTFDPSPGS